VHAGADERVVPEPVEGEQLRLDTITRLSTIAKTESLLVAQYERNQLTLSDAGASTLIAVDSRLAWLSGDVLLADQLLQKLKNGNTAAIDFALEEQIAQAALSGQWLRAATLLFEKAQTPAEQRNTFVNGDRLFGYLIRVTAATLSAELKKSREPDWRAWLEMQLAYRQGADALQLWQSTAGNRPQTPAAPRHLFAWLDASPIEHITLILPLDGSLKTAGEAVATGAISQLYQSYPNPAIRPQLTVLNLAHFASPRAAYSAAVNSGADMVLGPLTKSDVASLQQVDALPVPVIALNQPEPQINQAVAKPGWTTFSLAPEDEAQQIADAAFGDQCRNAVVMASPNDRGLRLLTAFEAQWALHGGTIRGKLVLEQQTAANKAMGELLGSGSSDQRIQSIEQAFDIPVDARGRGRSDFECIFMLAPDPVTARSWRPLLVFHMTGDVPVYATSAINDGVINTRNRDLNGVIFLETPAMLPPSPAGRLGRLVALGRDAMVMAQHWQQALTTENWIIKGQTGLLRRRADGSIARALNLATFDGAEVRALQ
jgi:outer membrane PBP1 activator LpoA protein